MRDVVAGWLDSVEAVVAGSLTEPSDQCPGEDACVPLAGDAVSSCALVRLPVVEYVRTFHTTANANVAIRTVKNAGRKARRRIS
jgi:hypothetical protein